ncbi:uncharacterized protein [Euphorbia lathyris]|uniref:uncharacterized protein n=1 Tax=Euphorbia lathyris TaxID=212925 RepID=UPI00331409F0
MEDCNMLAADCVVICCCCCCQCLMLQLFIFILIKLPYRIVRKTRKLARKKLRIGWKNKGKKGGKDDIRFDEIEGCTRIEVDEFGSGNCMEEVERILEELSEKGEFSFGSFWGRNSSSTCIDHLDSSVVQFELVEFVHSFTCSN